MRSFGVRNFRSLKEVEPIEIKPITVLLGKNSAGKSSFLRCFPLLKQTVEAKTSEPILWYGDYVDFGEYNECIYRESNDEPIVFSFEFEYPMSILQELYPWVGWPISFDLDTIMASSTEEKNFLPLSLTLFVRKHYVERVILSFKDQKIVIDFAEDGSVPSVKVNGDIYNSKTLSWINSNNIIPIFLIHYQRNSSRFRITSNWNIDNVVDELKLHCKKNTSEEKLYEAINSLPYLCSKSELLNHISGKHSKFPEMIQKYYSSINDCNNPEFLKINNAFLSSQIPSLFELVGKLLNGEGKNIVYAKPLRADVQRYYRVQGLGIDEIDPSGKNIPMFLSNMKEEDRREFSEWTRKNLGVEFEVKSSEGHISVMVKENNKSMYNIADVGVGYSQILPIAVDLWCVSRKGNNPRRYVPATERFEHTVVIEQPELHLHPAFQGKIVDLIANIASNVNSNHTRIVFETHSETMLSRLGYLVAKKKIDKNQINVLLFDKNSEGVTTIKTTSFNDNGMLEEWPIDFFSPESI